MDDTIPQDNVPRKRCPGCKERKPLTDEYFMPNHKREGKFYPPCRVCAKQRRKDSRQAHREQERQYFRQHYRKLHPQVHWKQDDHSKPFACKIHGEVEPYILTYPPRGKSEKANLLRRVCPLCGNVRNQKRRAQRRSIDGTLTVQQVQEKLRKQKYRCYYMACGHAKFEKDEHGQYIFHLEHTIPVSRSEANPHHDINFVVLACPACNLKKGKRLPHEWPEGGRLF